MVLFIYFFKHLFCLIGVYYQFASIKYANVLLHNGSYVMQSGRILRVQT